MPCRALRRCLALAIACAAPPAFADYEAGLAAARAGDYPAALREWRPLAEAGNRDAQFNLGLLYENGLGVPADGGEAVRWYRRAAEQDDRGAQAYLAEMYAKGLGVGRDDVEALRWYRKAAERGHAAAQYNVGLFYALGRGVAPDPVQAVAWMTVARESGAPQSEVLEALVRNLGAANLAEARRLAEDVRRQCRLD
ncbi:MAG TPA: tetratricopeptide repeat protein [Burkholderiales bacterium]|nr:tetratricopeptide repeat protein [Burkholderiales bacterium]